MTTPCAKHDEHNTRLGDLCAKLKAIEERIHPYEEMYADMYFGENSIKSRLRAQEEIVKNIRDDLKEMMSGLKWFIGILVGIIIAVYGASFGILWSEIQDSLKSPHSYSLPNMPSQQSRTAPFKMR